MGQVVHTLNEGKPVYGVTSLAGEIYVLRLKERDEVEVYIYISNADDARRHLLLELSDCCGTAEAADLREF